jgi:hypothetical protein
MNSSSFAILALILFLTVVTVAFIKLRRWQEGFEEESFVNPSVAAIPPSANTAPIQKNATFCPPGSKYFIDKRGDSLCCEGTIERRRCKGRIICTLSRASGKVPSCSAIHAQLRGKISTGFCPPSMPNFFANEATGKKGCTSSEITTSGDGPVHTTSPKCEITGNPDADLQIEGSCLNTKRLEEMQCIAPGCTKSFHSYRKTAPPVLTQTFTIAGETVPRSCTDDDSMHVYLDSVEPAWRTANKPEYDFEANINFCGVAKRVLVEKRLPASGAIYNPTSGSLEGCGAATATATATTA